MTLVSVEYAHIYTNSHIDDEHRKSLELLSDVKERFANDEINLVVLIDDYSFPDPTFSYDEFASWLDENGHKPDVMIRESQLIPVCDSVLALIDAPEIKQPIVDYIKAKKYPCSLFIAAWYLLRLGHIKSDQIELPVADKLLNILPESFKPFEDKGLEIISATPYKNVISQIEYEFIRGRLLA